MFHSCHTPLVQSLPLNEVGSPKEMLPTEDCSSALGQEHICPGFHHTPSTLICLPGQSCTYPGRLMRHWVATSWEASEAKLNICPCGCSLVLSKLRINFSHPPGPGPSTGGSAGLFAPESDWPWHWRCFHLLQTVARWSCK